MAASQAISAQPNLSNSGLLNNAQIELIWAMGLASIEANNGELVLPKPMGMLLSPAQVDDLKLRLR